jgi:hypothetical protein
MTDSNMAIAGLSLFPQKPQQQCKREKSSYNYQQNIHPRGLGIDWRASKLTEVLSRS